MKCFWFIPPKHEASKCWWCLLWKNALAIREKTSSVRKKGGKNLPYSFYLPSTHLGTGGTQVSKFPSGKSAHKLVRETNMQTGNWYKEVYIGVKACARYCVDLPGTILACDYGLDIIIHRGLSQNMSWLDNKLYGYPINSYNRQICLRLSGKIFHRLGQKIRD